LHPHQRIARAQICPDSIARFAKFAGDSGKEDAELVLTAAPMTATAG
jgi:hypothetical protein